MRGGWEKASANDNEPGCGLSSHVGHCVKMGGGISPCNHGERERIFSLFYLKSDRHNVLGRVRCFPSK